MHTQITAPLGVAAATVAAGQIAKAADSSSVDELIAGVSSKDDKVRGPAWQGAAAYGPAAIKALASLTADKDAEVARSAKRALWQIVRHAGRPGAGPEAQAAVQELIPLLSGANSALSREALWMLSEIAGDEAVGPMSALLANKELGEDARSALQRIPGKKVTAALREALATAPEKFKFHLAQSLRDRGEKVEGYPSQKLTPVKQTGVKAL